MKTIRMILALLLSALMMTGAFAEEADPAAAYENAMALYEAEDFEQAVAAFEALGAYKDSQKMLANSKWYWKEQRYDSAVALYKAESYAEAKALFEELGSFEESKSYVRKCDSAITAQTYEQAQGLYAAGDLAQARELFVALGDFKESESLIAEIDAAFAAQAQAAYELECYEKALILKAEGRLAEATKVVNQTLQSDPVDRVLALITSQLRINAHMKLAMEATGSTQQAQKALNINEYRAKHIQRQIRPISAEALQQRYQLCVDATYEIRSGQAYHGNLCAAGH